MVKGKCEVCGRTQILVVQSSLFGTDERQVLKCFRCVCMRAEPLQAVNKARQIVGGDTGFTTYENGEYIQK